MNKEQHEALKKIEQEFRQMTEQAADGFKEFARVWNEGQNKTS